MRDMPTKILFMGSPDFSLPTLEALDDHFQVIGVVTQPDRKSGRGRSVSPPPVKKFALKLGLPVYQPTSLDQPDFLKQLSELEPELIVVAAYGQILNQTVLSLPEKGCLNVHASLLPRWRGASPINAAILYGDSRSGVTIMKMDAGLDTGPILAQRSTPITDQDTAGTLFNRLARMGADLLVETLPAYLRGEIKPRPQDDSRATYAPLLSRSDGELDFNHSAQQLDRQVRAFHPWPGSFTFWENQRLIVHQARAVNVTSPGAGVLITYEGYPAVGTGKGILVLEEIQPAGKKPMAGDAFLRGAQDWESSSLARETGST